MRSNDKRSAGTVWHGEGVLPPSRFHSAVGGLEENYLGCGDKTGWLRVATGVYAEASLSWAGFKFYSFMFQKPANQPKFKT